MTSISVKQKKKRGRPATGKSPILALRLTQEQIDYFDAEAEKIGVSRSELIRLLLENSMAHIEAGTDLGKRLEEHIKNAKPSTD